MIRLRMKIEDNENLMEGKKIMPTKEEQKFVDFLIAQIESYKKCKEMTFDELTNELKKMIEKLEE